MVSDYRAVRRHVLARGARGACGAALGSSPGREGATGDAVIFHATHTAGAKWADVLPLAARGWGFQRRRVVAIQHGKRHVGAWRTVEGGARTFDGIPRSLWAVEAGPACLTRTKAGSVLVGSRTARLAACLLLHVLVLPSWAVDAVLLPRQRARFADGAILARALSSFVLVAPNVTGEARSAARRILVGANRATRALGVRRAAVESRVASITPSLVSSGDGAGQAEVARNGAGHR
mmetsp:Transcript_9767/g.28678  ORF Transcript_9767/g.28678 Transcript_9767/m.28678 type:complete len:235 (-) Transcript_9767:361-1065(-)